MGLDIRIKDLQLHHVPNSSVNVLIRAGEIVGITGENGAGKSELLRMIAGILRPKTMGEILIDGLDPFHTRDLERLHRRIGFAQQSPKDTMVFSRLIQDAPFGPENQAVAPDVIRKRWEGLKSRLLTGIPDRQAFDTLSGGQQQKAALASVLMLRSEILLLDEPTSMLGQREGKEVLDLLLKVARRTGQTVLLVTHDPETLAQMDRVYLLKAGTLGKVKKGSFVPMGRGEQDPYQQPKGAISDQRVKNGDFEEDGNQLGGALVNPLDQFSYESKGNTGVLRGNNASREADHEVRLVMKKRPDTAVSAIELQDVGIRFGKKTVVEHFSAEVCPGGYYELIGGTGSGKSSLCKLMNGTLFANSGKVVVNGIRLPEAGQKRPTFFRKNDTDLGAVRRFAGYVMQNPEDQLFETSVIFDVMYGPLRAGRKAMEARQDAEAALRVLEVPEMLWERRPESLSVGEQRRVAIAGILAMQPEVLILDEPYAGLDRDGCGVVKKMISNYIDEGHAVIVTGHA